jgi:hypothetical protein
MAIFNEMLGGGINAKDCTPTSEDILTGKSAAVGKEIVTGSMANQGAKTSTLTANGASYTIPKGYHNGSGKVTANINNLTAANIKKGVNIGGVVGSCEESPSWNLISSGQVLYLPLQDSWFNPFFHDMSCSPSGEKFFGHSYYGFYSNDGKEWTAVSDRSNFHFSISANVAGKKWISFLSSGGISISTDGLNWTAITSLTGSGGLRNIATHGDEIAICNGTSILYSPNGGGSWVTYETSMGSNYAYRKLYYSNNLGKWILVCGTSTSGSYYRVYTTTDFSAWAILLNSGNASQHLPVSIKDVGDYTVAIMRYVATSQKQIRNSSAGYLIVIDKNSNITQIGNGTGTNATKMMSPALEIFYHNGYYYVFCMDGSLYRAITPSSNNYILYKSFIGQYCEAKYSNGILSVVGFYCVNSDDTTNGNTSFYYMKIE